MGFFCFYGYLYIMENIGNYKNRFYNLTNRKKLDVLPKVTFISIKLLIKNVEWMLLLLICRDLQTK